MLNVRGGAVSSSYMRWPRDTMMYRGPVLFRTGNDHVATPSNLRVEMPEPASTPIRLTLWTLPNKKIFRYPVISEAAGLMKCQSLLVDNGWAPPVVMGTWQFGGFLSLPPLFIYGSYWQLAFALFLKRLSNSMNAFLSVFLKFFTLVGFVPNWEILFLRWFIGNGRGTPLLEKV